MKPIEHHHHEQTGGKQSPGLTASGAGAASAAPPAAGGSSYLETDQNPVTQTIACRVGCKSRFCPECCGLLGDKLKKDLIPVLASFGRVMMLTLTLDPQHFAGPKEAFEHIKAARCLSVTMQALRRAGVLNTDRWFCVIEWQANGWPHWHVLVDAHRIPFDTLASAWNVNLKKLGKTAADTRVGFGSVRFSKSDFANATHAANYAAKYLTKVPEHGFPEWVLNCETRKVHRYSASRGFWGKGTNPSDVSDEPGEERPRRTIAQQLATCGTKTAVLRKIERVDEETGEPGYRYEHIATLHQPLVELLAHVGCGQLNERGTRAVMPDNLEWLRREKSRSDLFKDVESL